MSKDSKYSAKIKLEIQETTGGKDEPFFDSEITYDNLGYAEVVGVELAMMGALNTLMEAGVVQAEALGMGDEIKAFLEAAERAEKKRGK